MWQSQHCVSVTVICVCTGIYLANHLHIRVNECVCVICVCVYLGVDNVSKPTLLYLLRKFLSILYQYVLLKHSDSIGFHPVNT